MTAQTPILAEKFSRRRKVTIWIGLVLLSLFIILMVIMEGPGSKPPGAPAAAKPTASSAPAPLQAANQQITDVIDHGATLVIAAHLAQGWDDKGYVDTSAVLVGDIGRAMRLGAPEGKNSKSVELGVFGPGADRLGAPVDIPLFHATFASNDLRQAHFENLSFARILALATSVQMTSEAGRSAALQWCRKDQNFSDAPVFCGAALN